MMGWNHDEEGDDDGEGNRRLREGRGGKAEEGMKEGIKLHIISLLEGSVLLSLPNGLSGVEVVRLFTTSGEKNRLWQPNVKPL